MYKAIVVDDERMIRNGICSMIPWERLGIGQVFTAASGAEAVKTIEAEKPDLMLTDICMAEMDGLTLIERVNALNPDIRIIVLTGYDNFEYVQKCCRMEVQDFLLKPAGEEELAQAIKKQVEELDRRVDIRHRQRMLRRVEGMAEQMEVERFMRRLLKGGVPRTEIEGFCENYRYPPGQPLQAVVLLPLLCDGGQWRGYGDLLNLSVKGMCAAQFDSAGQGITAEDDTGRVVIAVFVDSQFDEPVERVAQLKALLADEFNMSPRVVMGSVVHGLGELSLSYNDACKLLDTSVAREIGEILQPRGSEQRLRLFGETFQELKKIMSANLGDTDMLLKAFSTFEKATRSYNISHSLVRRFCYDLGCALYFSYIVETGESADNRLTGLLNSLLACSGEEACRVVRDFIQQMVHQEDAGTHELIAGAKRYIKDHLAEELSVSSIAGRLFVTPNYFSRLFKKVCGEGCNEYIVRKRIEKARGLLETTTLKTGRIAGMVGYRDTNYFSLAFKKHTGLSPTEYREKNRAAYP